MFGFPDNITVELTTKKSDGTTVSLGLTVELLPKSHDDVYQTIENVIRKARKAGDDLASILRSLETQIAVLSTAVVGWTVADDRWNGVFKTLGEKQSPPVEWDATYSKEKALALLSFGRSQHIRLQLDEALGKSDGFIDSDSKS